MIPGRRLKQKYGGDYEENMKMAIKKRKYLIHKATGFEEKQKLIWNQTQRMNHKLSFLMLLYEFNGDSVYLYLKCDQ